MIAITNWLSNRHANAQVFMGGGGVVLLRGLRVKERERKIETLGNERESSSSITLCPMGGVYICTMGHRYK